MTPDQERLILGHLEVPRIIVGSLRSLRWYPDRDGLLAAGNLGLVQAAVSYRPDHACSFRSWAGIRVRGAIYDEVRTVQFGSRSAHDGPIALHHAAIRLGGQPTEAELAAELGWTVRQVQRAMVDDRDTRIASLDEIRVAAGDVFASDDPGPADLIDQAENLAELRAAMATLTPRLRLVITERFMHGRKMAAIAADLGVTESRISQLVSEGLRKLHDALAATDVETSAA